MSRIYGMDEHEMVGVAKATVDERTRRLREGIVGVINQTCAECGSNTPDFMLADYLLDCLDTWDKFTGRRDKWYGVDMRPGSVITREMRAAAKRRNHEL